MKTFGYTEFKIFNIQNQNRSGQNRRFYVLEIWSDEEIEDWIIWKYGILKRWKLIKRSTWMK